MILIISEKKFKQSFKLLNHVHFGKMSSGSRFRGCAYHHIYVDAELTRNPDYMDFENQILRPITCTTGGRITYPHPDKIEEIVELARQMVGVK